MSSRADNVLAGIFGAQPTKGTDRKSIDETLGSLPAWVRRTKGAAAIWYGVAERHADRLKPRHRDHVEQYTRGTLRVEEIERLLARMTVEDRYSTSRERMWLAQAQGQRNEALRQLRSLKPIGSKPADD